jgi:cyclase
MQEIAPDVYVETDSRGTNLGLILTKAGPVLVDTPLIPREARAWREKVLALAGRDPLYVINTDHHKGHALGNIVFGATTIAHEAAWKHMHGYGDNFRQRLSDRYRDKDPETSRELLQLVIQLPDLTFEERLTLYLGDKTIKILHVGGHTPASSLVLVSEVRVLFTGDVVVCNMHPFMAQSDTRKWLDALIAIRRMPINVLVPGHGQACGKEATEPLSEYIRTARAKVRKQFNAGKSKAESSNAVLAEIMSWFPRSPASGVKLEAKVKSGLGHIYDEFRIGDAANKAEAPAGADEE